jgi:hypothetical protein
MAATVPQIILTGHDPVPHSEIQEVTCSVHAAAKSLQEKGHLVSLAEVMG